MQDERLENVTTAFRPFLCGSRHEKRASGIPPPKHPASAPALIWGSPANDARRRTRQSGENGGLRRLLSWFKEPGRYDGRAGWPRRAWTPRGPSNGSVG